MHPEPRLISQSEESSEPEPDSSGFNKGDVRFSQRGESKGRADEIIRSFHDGSSLLSGKSIEASSNRLSLAENISQGKLDQRRFKPLNISPKQGKMATYVPPEERYPRMTENTMYVKGILSTDLLKPSEDA